MYRRIPAVAAAMLSLFCLLPASARADDDGVAVHKSGGIGFHQTAAPLGVRWWLAGQKVGVDLGLGFSSDPSLAYSGKHLKTFVIAGGIPIRLQSWSRMHVLFRPGVLFQSEQVETFSGPPAPFSTESEKTLLISGEIEAEAFLLENFSVSASTGIAYESFDPSFGLDKEKSFRTVGGNFTNVGFHVYLCK
ncbi:MAG TPA: hypothetical protein VN972_02675 [Methylomirabilota bacterium]|nr:hypothetical protein [Methylomirabilota bacterium]